MARIIEFTRPNGQKFRQQRPQQDRNHRPQQGGNNEVRQLMIEIRRTFQEWLPDPKPHHYGHRDPYWTFHKVIVDEHHQEVVGYYDYVYRDYVTGNQVTQTHLFTPRNGRMICIKKHPPRYRYTGY